MSGLPLGSLPSDTLPGCHATTQPRRNSTSSHSPRVSESSAFLLRSFILDEEIRLQQQRLQHMLQLREQQHEEQSQAHVEQEIQHKHRTLQQRLLATAGGQRVKKQNPAQNTLHFSLPTSETPPALPGVALKEDGLPYSQREYPCASLQCSDDRLSVSQLQFSDSSKVGSTTLLIANEAHLPPRHRPLPQHMHPQQVIRRRLLIQENLQQPAVEQHDVQHAALQQHSVKHAAGQHSTWVRDSVTQEPDLQRPTGQLHVCQRKELPKKPASEPDEVRRVTEQPFAEQVAFINWEGEALRENRVSLLPSTGPSSILYSAAAQVAAASSPYHTIRSPSHIKAHAQCEVGNDLQVDRSGGEHDAFTLREPFPAGGRAGTVCTAQPEAPPQAEDIGKKKDALPASSGAGVSASSMMATEHKREEPQLNQVPSEACTTSCGDRVGFSSCRPEASAYEEMCFPNASTFGVFGKEETFSAATVTGAPSSNCAGNTQLPRPNWEVCPTQPNSTQHAQLPAKERVRSGGVSRLLSTEGASGKASHSAAEGNEGDAEAGGSGGGQESAVEATEEAAVLQRGTTSFKRLDLGLAISQQLRSSHIARGTESAVIDDMEETLQKSRKQDLMRSLEQRRDAPKGSREEERGLVTWSSAEREDETRVEGGDASLSKACDFLDAHPDLSDGAGSVGREETRKSDVVHLQQLAEKLREQETEKRLMQEESFQLEQMLKRQYFQDIQQKEAEKEQLQLQLNQIQQLGTSLERRLIEVTHQKNQLCAIIMLAQEALVQAVASSPRSPRRVSFQRGKRSSSLGAGKPKCRRASPAAAAAVSGNRRFLEEKEKRKAEDANENARKAEEHLSAEEEREHEEQQKLLECREEVSRTLLTLLNRLKCAIEVFGTHEFTKDEEAALAASLQRAIAACRIEEKEEMAEVLGSENRSDVPRSPGDLLSDTKEHSQKDEELMFSEVEEDSEIVQQLRRLQEEVNVLRKNLKAFTDGVLAAHKQHHRALVGRVEKNSSSAIELSPGKDENGFSAPPPASREVLPPHELALQRLEEVQTLNAKLLLDNTILHRLCAQQAANSPVIFPSRGSFLNSVGYTADAAAVEAAPQAGMSNGHLHKSASPVQKVHCLLRGAAQWKSSYASNRARTELFESAAPPRAAQEVQGHFSPSAVAPPAPSGGTVPKHAVPCRAAVPSSVKSVSLYSGVAPSKGGTDVLDVKWAAGTAGVLHGSNRADGAVVQAPSAAFAWQCVPQGGFGARMIDAVYIRNSDEPRSASPQLLPALRRELWPTPGVATSPSCFEYNHPPRQDEHVLVQAHMRSQELPLEQNRLAAGDTPTPALAQMEVYAGETMQNGYKQRVSSQQPFQVSQQNVVTQASGKLQPVRRGVRPVNTTIYPALPRRGAAARGENAMGPRAQSLQDLEEQWIYPLRGRPSGAASTHSLASAARGAELSGHSIATAGCAAAAAAAVEQSLPRLPQYSKSGRTQAPLQGTMCRPAVTLLSSGAQLPLLRSQASGSSAVQAQRQRGRTLSSVGSGGRQGFYDSQSLTLLHQGHSISQSERVLPSRSYAQVLIAGADSPRVEAAVPCAGPYRVASPVNVESAASIDLTVRGHRVVGGGKTSQSAARINTGAAERAASITAARQRRLTDAIPPKVFHRTRRASAAVGADYLPALTPAHSDSRLLVGSEERRKQKQSGSCAIGRCWLGVSAAGQIHHAARPANPKLRPLTPSTYTHPVSPVAHELARLPSVSPVASCASHSRKYVNSPLGHSPASGLLQGSQSHTCSCIPALAHTRSTVAPDTFSLTSQNVVPSHSPDTRYRHYNAAARSSPVVLPYTSQKPQPQCLSSVASTPAAYPMSVSNGMHIPKVFLPASAFPVSLTSSTSHLKFCRESVVPQPQLSTDLIDEIADECRKIPAAHEL